MQKDIEKLIIYYIEDFFSKEYNQVIDFTFEIIEGYIYLFIQFANGKMIKKVNLNITKDYLDDFYNIFYKEFKNNYLNSSTKKIKIQEITDLTNIENPYLVLYVKDIHKNIIKIELKNHGYVQDILNSIKEDWLTTINDIKKNKRY